MSIKKPTVAFRKKCAEYKIKAISFYEEANVARNYSLGEPLTPCDYDFSEKALQDMFNYETYGIGYLCIDGFSETKNGFAIGQKWLNVEIKRKKNAS